MRTLFERAALAFSGLMVAATAVVASTHTPSGVTHAPRAFGLLWAPEHETLAPRVHISIPKLPRPEKLARADSADVLDATFRHLGYSLEGVEEAGHPVPRLFLASLPADLKNLRVVERKKAMFLTTVLPLILRVNEEILEERARLWRLVSSLRLGYTWTAEDRLWVTGLADKYGTEPTNLKRLLARVDTVPTSLALAQAAEESGWGTSRFARKGNAIFGQWTYSETAPGIVPKARKAGAKHRVRAFEELIDSVRAYMTNLNSHDAYRSFRVKRQQLRRKGVPPSGTILAGTLTRYSERGQAYVRTIRGMIATNRLERLDDARLVGPEPRKVDPKAARAFAELGT